jgi:hypothetical protein
MAMMKIKYFSNFCSSHHCQEKVELICESAFVEKYKRDFVITSGDDYTHAIILNTAMPELSIPRENVIGFAFEPPIFLNCTKEFIEYAQNTIGKYYIGEKGDLPEPFTEGFAFMWHISPPPIIPHKVKLCSIMVSEKTFTQGHKYRHELVRSILSTNLPIDIYGRGCKFLGTKDSRIRGDFKEMDRTMYLEYHFHIAVENVALPDYISEKILNPLLCGTTPIYWGCPRIDEYFPNTNYTLSGNIKRDMNMIISIMREPQKYIKKIDISMIKERTNILKNANRLFD